MLGVERETLNAYSYHRKLLFWIFIDHYLESSSTSSKDVRAKSRLENENNAS